MDYSKLSDFEINKLVAIASRLLVQEIDDSKSTGMTSKYHELRPHTVWVSDGENPWEQFAPTLCWEDAGPIIQAAGISIVKYGHGMWLASSDAYWVDGVEWQIDGEAHQNPLRAAMIVFLMMQDSANVSASSTGSDIR
ncbi:TPA: DUF2591 domain-containing protein [Citrobacter freundii]|uniref:phage protein NinX family protein n=1 Tax=Citrobacter freundii TaxID=546 RepID=UPI0012A8E789|nr:phage protein NinX family protein [Citrobacter freundii]EKX9187390.1 DUF2591 family protein [Citrobacter freundii]QFI11568.1 DUF2591 domain-containing protein [Citrobacter freundii]QFI27954.1 DUF2591 domain-containing protein [Citrobacter freundii]HAT2734620.1 DUF2591 domain-containing protein [Citrobacter freundii]HAT2739722.1 DUF2591 domain-containing protein [Citrobacter freundii]